MQGPRNPEPRGVLYSTGDRFEICPQIIQTGVFQQPEIILSQFPGDGKGAILTGSDRDYKRIDIADGPFVSAAIGVRF